MFRVPHGPWTILVVGVWGRFYSGVYGREMSQGWDEGDGNKVSIDKELMEGGRR